MIIEIAFHATPERIQVRAPQAQLFIDTPNIVAFHRKSGKVVGIGETESDFQKASGEKWEQEKSDIGYVSLLTFNGTTPNFDQAALEYYTVLAHMKIKSGLAQTFGYFFIDQFNYDLSLTEYPKLSRTEQLDFEYLLQTRFKSHRVTINGTSVEIPAWKRNVEGVLRFILITLVPLAILYFGVTGYRPTTVSEMVVNWLAIGSLGFGMAIIGKFIWMAAMRDFVPQSYLKYHLPKLALRFANRPMADFLLKDNRK